MYFLIILIGLVLVLALTYRGRGYWAWVLGGAFGWIGWRLLTGTYSSLGLIFLGIFLLVALTFGVYPIRLNLVSRFLLPLMKSILPRMGETERIALEAGTVWWDGDLFSGDPDWNKLLDFKIAGLSEKERAFLEGPCRELCEKVREWDVLQQGDLPKAVWDFFKKHRFFGMIIPETYGGLGFSARAHADVVTKLASRSMTAAVTVMVPNSLGPAELLMEYGTEEQKRYYLPRLARGEEIPCFALTGPEAGSDAAATQSTGVICRSAYEGREVLGMRLNWRKRYITLGPVATLIGLAFRLFDPEHLVGEKEDLGITCALIPSHLPGIDIGRRHDPMGVPFQNGPNFGHDVFVPLDFIIGGQKMAGKGWRMLMESLAAGRSISLPSLAAAGAQTATRIVGAYATVREQFDTPIGRFEGIEEPLARIGGLTYLINGARRLTLGALDAGHKPAVISAILKAYTTDLMRAVIQDAMDIRAGAAICEGPRNLLAQIFKGVPIGITVEGANILTRSMIIYGQGAIRCHPFVEQEMQAVADNNLELFDRAFFGHINFVFKNLVRSFLLGVTGARWTRSPVRGETKKYFQKLSRMSSCFALISDVAMATLGGTLKRKEKISGRLADALAWMYLTSGALKKFEDEGRREADSPLIHWSLQHALYLIQEALRGVIENLPNRPAAWILKGVVFPWGARLRPPADKLGSAVARSLLEDRGARLHLTQDIYLPPPEEPGLGRIEAALDKAVEALAVETKIRDAVRAGKLDRAPGDILLEAALQAGLINSQEYHQVKEAKEIRDEVIQVDSFDPETFRQLRS